MFVKHLCPPWTFIIGYQISFQYVQPLRRKWLETANNWNFSNCKGHNSAKNCSIVPKTELDLDILVINLYTKYHFSMCNLCKENERKLQIYGIVLSPGTITLSKMAHNTWLRYSYDKSVYQISFQYVQLVRRKWTETTNLWNVLSPRAITLSNMAWL
jgi:hypothetical protein